MTRAQTLPPDGTVLDEVIADLIEERGPPPTPQDFRLVLKVAEKGGKERAEAQDSKAGEGAETQPESPRNESGQDRPQRQPQSGRSRSNRRRGRGPRNRPEQGEKGDNLE